MALSGLVVPAAASAAAGSPATPAIPRSVAITSNGLRPGAIKHVWLIILENKSFDATFTGLNKNSYLWKTLPAQGVLLKNYYGTGHSSMDNYLSMVSGQAPEEDTQADCSVANTLIGPNSNIISKLGPNFGQMNSPANASQPSGANAANGKNGCTYPTNVPTLFNQLSANNETWKGYAQDLHGAQAAGSTQFVSGTVPNREDAVCGGPGTPANNPITNPTSMSGNFPAGVTSFTGAQANDQYVAKHFPFPWFESLTGQVAGSTSKAIPPLNQPAGGGTNCDASHIANLDDPSQGLFRDLQSVRTTPNFSWITPNNCSDAHDALCKGNNLSGAFNSNGTPNYNSPIPNNPESTTPVNFTGGLYASDLFLEYYIPMIEKSPAFKQGGLIDVTFDEANPPFTYSGNSFNNANAFGPTSSDQPNATAGIAADAAGENIFGRDIHTEPTGPNSTLGVDSSGNQLYPGPGNNSFIDRPPVCTQTSPTLVPADCVPGIVRGGSGNSPAARTDKVTGSTTTNVISDNSIVADDTGRAVTGAGIPASSFVGAVTDTGPDFPATSAGPVITGSFQLVDASGNAVSPTAAPTSITLSAEGDPADLAPGQTADPLFDAKDATPGGGDTGSVLISPFIKPGSVSDVYYNHYSWLRTMEDLFGVAFGHDRQPLNPGSVSGGLDGLGHLGYAAQLGLRPFGLDVFNRNQIRLTAATSSGASTPAAPSGSGGSNSALPAGVGLALVAAAGVTGYALFRRQRGWVKGH